MASLTLPGDHHTGHGVGHACAGREECDAHDAVGDTEREPDDRHHPHHEIGEDGDPQDRVEEGHNVPSLPSETSHPKAMMWEKPAIQAIY